MAHKLKAGRTRSLPAGLAIATGIDVGLTLIFSFLLARLVSAEKLEWAQVGYGIMFMVFAAAVIGTKTACALIRRRKLLVCTAMGVLYWLSLLLATALFFGGQYSGIGVTAIIIFFGSGLVCAIELRGEGGRKNGLHGKTIKKQMSRMQ